MSSKAKRTYTKYNKKATKRWYHKPARAALGGFTSVAIDALRKKLGLNTEAKFLDTTGAVGLANSLAVVLKPTAPIPQGLTTVSRVGDSIRVTHINIKGDVQLGSSVGQQIRVICTIQKSCQQGQLTAAQLLQDPTNINSPYNDQLEGVRVIHDKVHVYNPQISGVSATYRLNWRWSPPVKQGHVIWTDADTTGVSADIIGGLIQVWMMTDQASNAPTWASYCRIRYVDN